MNKIINDLTALEYNKQYRVWEPFMKKYKCDVIGEIGVRFGWNFEQMIKHKPKLAVAVDIWRNDGIIARNDLAFSQDTLDTQYRDFKDRMKNNSFVHVHREYSFTAVKKFPDNYFDFVYIDADHTYEGCLQDIIDWYPKVKKGKFLLGDDYRRHKTLTGVRFGVIEAVNRFAQDNNLSFFVFPKSKWGVVKV
jgi:hypothetical protein